MLKLVLYSLLLLMSFHTTAFDCSNHKKVEVELLKLEFSGAHITAKSKCLAPENFKRVKSIHSPSEEKLQQAKYFISSMDSVVVKERKEVDSNIWMVDLQIQTLSGALLKDQMKYMLNMGMNSQKVMGCATILSAPLNRIQLSQCK